MGDKKSRSCEWLSGCSMVRREGCPRLRFANPHRLRAAFGAASAENMPEGMFSPLGFESLTALPGNKKSRSCEWLSGCSMVRREGFEPPTY